MSSANESLLAEIQIKREKMIESAAENGFTSKETIQLSQELDQLLYQYQCKLQTANVNSQLIKWQFKKSTILWARPSKRIEFLMKKK